MGSSESTLVKISHCWKSHVAAQIMDSIFCFPHHQIPHICNLKKGLQKFLEYVVMPLSMITSL